MAIYAKTIMNKAISFLGVKEKPANSNNVVFNTDYYGKPVSGAAYPWCCAFVWDIYRLCGASKLFYDGQKTAYCPTVASWGKSKGLIVDKTKGQYGDIVLFDWGKDGVADHIGLIEKNKGNGVYDCIEGNTAVGNDSNGGCVMRRERNTSQILCIIRPKYDKEVVTAKKPTATVTSKSSKADILWLQQKLNKCLNSTYKAKLNNKKLAEDSVFAGQTSLAVKYYWQQLGWTIANKGSDGYYHAGSKTINALADGKTK